MSEPLRPSPEQLLKRVEAEERFEHRGRLKVFLGYASGVGKSLRMLDEGRRRKARGQDVVVAAIQASSAGEDLIRGLELIPMRPGNAIDVEAVLRRHPAVCLIDGLAYRNPPGSNNVERWQDVDELLGRGISVITTINLQYISEKKEQVKAILGHVADDSVPGNFLRRADDIEVVDAPPEYCANREGAQRQLSEMRELALLLAAEVVDAQLDGYFKRNGIAQQNYGTHERILVCITPRSNAELMIRRARKLADRFHGELFVGYVEQPDLSSTDRATLEANMECARRMHARIEVLQGEDPVSAILQFSSLSGITQIFVGHSQRSGFWQKFKTNPVERLILESAGGIDIRIFPQKEQGSVT